MATTKPRTNAKRPTASRSVRVTKKKQGVNRKQAFILVGVLAVIGVVAVVASKAATKPSNLYISVKGGNNATVHRIATDGSTKTSYSVSFLINSALALSRDKLKLEGRSGGSSQAVLNSASGNVISNVNCPTSSYGCYGQVQKLLWLPGDKTFAFARTNGDSIRIANVGSTTSSVIAQAPATDSFYCLSLQRSGKRLMYRANKRIITMNIDGSDSRTVKTLTSKEFNLGCPSWSANDKKISYNLQVGTSNYVYNQVMLRTINADGSGEATLAALTPLRTSYDSSNQDTNRSGSGPGIAGEVWSPGSSSILFVKSINNVQNLYYINVSTKKVVQVTSNTSSDTKVSHYGWSNDGYIIYTDGKHSDASITKSAKTVKSIKPDLKTAPKTLLRLTDDSYVDSIAF